MEIALAGFACLLLLCFIGFPLGFSTLFVGFVGFAYTREWHWQGAMTMLGQQVMETGSNYSLSVIPLFILMGSFIHRSNISEDLFHAGFAFIGFRKGGLAKATVLACAGFSAVSGSSLATTATMTKVAVPYMRKYGYADSLSSGVVAAGGTLGIMIPPSVPLVIYGLMAEEDIGKLFIAATVPGILLVLLYLAAVRVSVWRNPSLGQSGERLSRSERYSAYAKIWPVIALFILVLGGIYIGAFTPTEASGIGAFGAAIFAYIRGSVRSWPALFDILLDSTKTTAILFSVIFGALVFANFINMSGLHYDLLDMVAAWNLGPLGVVLFVCLICVVLGMVFEAIGLLLLIVPVFLPSLQLMAVDMIWFGIIVVVVIEMALITPPIGMNVFTVRAVMPDLKLVDIFKGVTVFVIADLVALVLIITFPFTAVGLVTLLR